MSDIAETIARWKGRLERTKMMRVTVYEIEADELTALLSAAEAGIAARDAALEEAATVVEYIWDRGLAGAHGGEQCNRTANAIRALRSKP